MARRYMDFLRLTANYPHEIGSQPRFAVDLPILVSAGKSSSVRELCNPNSSDVRLSAKMTRRLRIVIYGNAIVLVVTAIYFLIIPTCIVWVSPSSFAHAESRESDRTNRVSQ